MTLVTITIIARGSLLYLAANLQYITNIDRTDDIQSNTPPDGDTQRVHLPG